MWAGHRKLDKLVVIVDKNNLQIEGEIDKVCSPYPIDKKFEAFNFHTIVIDGNDFDQIRAAFEEAKKTKGQPTAIIAKTIKGKGVSFMENEAGWHGKAPNDEQYAQAKAEVEVKNNTVTGNTVEQMLKDAIIVTFDGKTYTSVASVTDKDGALDIGEVEATLNDGTKIKKDNNNLNTNISAGKYFTVTKLTVKVKVATGIDTYVTVTVPGAITAK